MRICRAIGCSGHVDSSTTEDYCKDCLDSQVANRKLEVAANQGQYDIRPVKSEEAQDSSGGDNDYWIATITHPKRLVPYDAECEDLIEHFQMTFQEGEAFKALWRKGQSRIGNGKPGDTPFRNSEKVAHFGARMVAMEQRGQ